MMLRSSAVAWAAALRRRLSLAPAVLHPPIPVPTHGHGPISKGLLPRGYARMRHRIPPTRPEMESSESDADEEEVEEEEKRETGVDAEGPEEEEGSEEWEGFVLDFGAGEKKGNEEKGEEKEEWSLFRFLCYFLDKFSCS